MKHILLVDDVTLNIKCAVEILKDSYEITTAKSGRKALLSLKETVPDLILLDEDMPEMSGYDVLEKIKAEANLADIPVIFLTENEGRLSESSGLSMGVADYICKPFKIGIVKYGISAKVFTLCSNIFNVIGVVFCGGSVIVCTF